MKYLKYLLLDEWHTCHYSIRRFMFSVLIVYQICVNIVSQMLCNRFVT